MLVLSRKLGEVIRIAEEIEVVVVEIRGKTVRLGIEAPRKICVLRSELVDRPPGDERKGRAA